MVENLDDVDLGLSDAAPLVIKAMVAIFLFGVALNVRPADVLASLRRPSLFAVTLVTQFVVVPGLSVLIIPLLDVRPSVAVGLLLVACCPAGNLSNILAYRARADVALSVSLISVSNAAAALLTPLAFVTWAGLVSETDPVFAEVRLDPASVLVEVAALILLPFGAGMALARLRPEIAGWAHRIVEPLTVLLLGVVLIVGISANFTTIVTFAGVIVAGVVVQNLVSLAAGRAAAFVCRLGPAAARTMTLEVGVRNTGLGLVLTLSFFPTVGGVAITVALWGLWDLAVGFALASWWRRRGPSRDAPIVAPMKGTRT